MVLREYNSLVHSQYLRKINLLLNKLDLCVSFLLELGSFHINCGGNKYSNGSIIYERDLDNTGPSNYVLGPSNWALSNTGHFLDDNSDPDQYILNNKSALSTGTSQLDMDARISAISLAYYGFCLENGNYTINLYFAETAFTSDNTYGSLGRRVFDVYIQVIGFRNGLHIYDCFACK